MSTQVEIIDGGLGVSVQDTGRKGYRSIGVPLAGALDVLTLAAANVLAGNAPDAPAFEVRLSGPTLALAAGESVRIGLAGGMGAALITPDGARRTIDPNSAVTLRAGDVLKVGRTKGTGYLALSGGVQVPRMLGSASTYARAALGGIAGREPRRGDRLFCAGAGAGDDLRAGSPVPLGEGPIRVMPGPQEDHFTPEAYRVLFESVYSLTPAMDRMGLRLEGPRLAHSALGPDIVSDGVAPGAIQVPADGRPIILLADGQTTGGYAKIATVIRADLPRLAHLRPGDTLRFTPATREAAALARAEQRAAFARWVAALEPYRPPGQLDAAVLLGVNLITGVTAGHDEMSF